MVNRLDILPIEDRAVLANSVDGLLVLREPSADNRLLVA